MKTLKPSTLFLRRKVSVGNDALNAHVGIIRFYPTARCARRAAPFPATPDQERAREKENDIRAIGASACARDIYLQHPDCSSRSECARSTVKFIQESLHSWLRGCWDHDVLDAGEKVRRGHTRDRRVKFFHFLKQSFLRNDNNPTLKLKEKYFFLLIMY